MYGQSPVSRGVGNLRPLGEEEQEQEQDWPMPGRPLGAATLLGYSGSDPESLGSTWYEFVWHIDPRDLLEKWKLGLWLGPSHSVGDAMCYKVLNSTGLVLVRSSVLPLTPDDMNSEVVKEKMQEFTTQLEDHLGIRMAGLPVANDDDILWDEMDETIGLHADQITPEFAPYGDDTVGVQPMMHEADEMDHDAYDKYISARLMIPDASGIARSAQVKRQKRNEDGNLIGHSHSNPILETGLYEVEFDDGQAGTYAANVIAENIYVQIDDEGFAYTLLVLMKDLQNIMGDGFRSVLLMVGKMTVQVGFH
jgi:hypothetical protein